MGGRGYRFLRRAAAAGALALAATAAESQVPQSGYQQGLGLAPELADYLTLMYELPQTAVRFPGQVFGIAETGWDEYAVGASYRVGSTVWFVLSQWSPGVYGYDFSILDEQTLQGGWAVELGQVRAGAALRGGVENAHSTESRFAPGDYQYKLTTDITNRLLEVAAGLGVGDQRTRADLAVALGYRELDYEFVETRVDEGGSHARRSFLDSGEDPWGTVSLAGRLPAGAETAFSVFGRFGNRDVDWKAGLSSEDESERFERDTYGDTWLAAVALETVPRHLDWLAISADYRSKKVCAGGVQPDEITMGRWTVRQGALAISAKQRIYRDITAHAGVRKAYTYERIEAGISHLGDDSRVRDSRSEDLADRFYLGSAGSWNQIHVAGSINTSLSLDNFFVTLDIRVHL